MSEIFCFCKVVGVYVSKSPYLFRISLTLLSFPSQIYLSLGYILIDSVILLGPSCDFCILVPRSTFFQRFVF